MNDTLKAAFVGAPDKESCIKNADDLRDAMSHIQPIDHDFSVKIGMAVNDEFGEEARDIWIDWALGREKATRAKVTSSWKSFKRNGGITIATVVAEAKASGWQPNGHQSAPFTPEQQAEREARKAQLNAIAAAETKQKAADTAKAAEKAKREWHEATEPDHGHPYAKAKQIKPYGARQLKDDRLIIPLRNKAGEICSSQTINSNGVKKYEKSGAKAGAHSTIGNLDGADTVLLCEGWATGCSLHEATGYPVVVCLDSGNLSKISKNLPNVISPLARLVICGDRDESEAGQKAAASALNGLNQIGRRAVVVLPVFSGANASLTDFNDLATSEGIDTVKQQINAAMAKPTAKEPVPEEEPAQPESSIKPYARKTGKAIFNRERKKWFIKGLLPQVGICSIFGESGSGKTFLILDMLATIAASAEDPERFGTWAGYKTTPAKVVYVALEDLGGIGDRVESWCVDKGLDEPPALFSTVLMDEAFGFAEFESVCRLAETVRDANIVVIDTLAQGLAGLDENSSEGMGKANNALKIIQAATGGLIIAVHHTGKDKSKGARGHSSLHCGLDVAIQVGKENGYQEWEVVKTRYGKTKLAGKFEIDTIDLGEVDEDGDLIEGGVARQLDESEVNRLMALCKPKKPASAIRKGCAPDLLLNHIKANEKKLGKLFQSNDEDVPEKEYKAIPVDVLFKHCISKNLFKGDRVDKTFHNAISTLLKANLIKQDEDGNLLLV